MNLRFVEATIEDAEEIFAQAKELIDTYEDISSIDYDKVLAWMKRKIERNISQYRCVLADGIKCAWWRLCEDGELDDLYVLPGFRNMGIGSLIMEKCIEDTKQDLYLYVFSCNTRAISFYERFGFVLRQTVGQTRLILERKG